MANSGSGATAAPLGGSARERAARIAADQQPVDVTVPVDWLDRLRDDVATIAEAASLVAARIDRLREAP